MKKLLIITLLLIPTITKADLLTNLQGYWDLDEASGVREDSTANNNDLTDNNTVLSGAGIIGNGADFEDSNSEYLSITDGSQTGLDLQTAFTFSFWIKFESNAGNPVIISKYGGSAAENAYFLQVISGTGIRLCAHDGASEICGSTINWTPSNGSQYHVVFTFDDPNNLTELYVNGVSLGTGAIAISGVNNGTGTFRLGSYVGSNYIDGIIDEFGVWSRELTPSEVTDLYNGGSGLAYPLSPSSGGGSDCTPFAGCWASSTASATFALYTGLNLDAYVSVFSEYIKVFGGIILLSMNELWAYVLGIVALMLVFTIARWGFKLKLR